MTGLRPYHTFVGLRPTPQLLDAAADLRADLDDRLVQLALDRIAKRLGARGQQLRHVRAELPRVGIDDLKFLFDADRERVPHDGPPPVSYFCGAPPHTPAPRRCRRSSCRPRRSTGAARA